MAKKDIKAIKAADRLRKYCKRYSKVEGDCSKCVFVDEDYVCAFDYGIPSTWELPILDKEAHNG